MTKDADLNLAGHLKQDYFNNPVSSEFFSLMCGDVVGVGISRTVFDYKPDPTCVIKFEGYGSHFQNVLEWDLWKQYNQNPRNKITRWLAPCVSISHSGSILIQKKTKPVPFTLKLPTHVPAMFGDMKRENFGMYQGRVVCHDYGRHESVFVSSHAKWEKAQWLGAENGKFKKAAT